MTTFERLGETLMAHSVSNDMKPFLRTPEASDFLGLKRSTLERWRVDGGGPPYRRHGRAILYAREDLQAWSDARTAHSTSEVRTSGSGNE
ncbi:MAG: helix-turn-helix domain-containing protein [Acidobacteriota bacterium]